MRRIMSILAVATAVTAFALLVAGCGSTSKSDYQKQVKSTLDGIKTDFANLPSPTGDATKDAAVAKKYDEAAASLDKAAKKLDDIEPPSDVKKEHASLVSAVEDLSKVFTGIGAALVVQGKGTPASQAKAQKMMLAEQTRLQGAVKKIEVAQASFIKKGYTGFKDKSSS